MHFLETRCQSSLEERLHCLLRRQVFEFGSQQLIHP